MCGAGSSAGRGPVDEFEGWVARGTVGLHCRVDLLGRCGLVGPQVVEGTSIVLVDHQPVTRLVKRVLHGIVGVLLIWEPLRVHHGDPDLQLPSVAIQCNVASFTDGPVESLVVSVVEGLDGTETGPTVLRLDAVEVLDGQAVDLRLGGYRDCEDCHLLSQLIPICIEDGLSVDQPGSLDDLCSRDQDSVVGQLVLPEVGDLEITDDLDLVGLLAL